MTHRHLEIVQPSIVRRLFAGLRHPEVTRRES